MKTFFLLAVVLLCASGCAAPGSIVIDGPISLHCVPDQPLKPVKTGENSWKVANINITCQQQPSKSK